MPQTCAWISPIGGKFALAEALFVFSDDCANADAAIDSAATSQKPRRQNLEELVDLRVKMKRPK
jgi:hypothetical protein